MVLMYSSRCSCQIVVKFEFSRQFFEKYSNIKFHENSFSDSRVVPCGQTDRRTDMAKLIVVVCSFSNAPSDPLIIIIIIIIIIIVNSIGLSPGGSGYFTCIQNMKFVTNKFKSGGLHEKHVVATWNVGNHLSICL